MNPPDTAHSTVDLVLRKAATVAGCALAYRFGFLLNDLVFGALQFAPGVNWVFLPSGLRLLLVLLFGVWGALGVVVGSVAGNWIDAPFGEDLVTAMIAGVLSGFAPLLAREICVRTRGLHDDLHNLDGRALLEVAVVFTIVSALMHAGWFALRGSSNFLPGLAVLQIGDLTGTLIILYSSRMLLRLFLRDNLR